jgi:hypothetical protein
MCFRRARYPEETTEEIQGRRLWDLFWRETERSTPPTPVAVEDEEPMADRDRDEVPTGAES